MKLKLEIEIRWWKRPWGWEFCGRRGGVYATVESGRIYRTLYDDEWSEPFKTISLAKREAEKRLGIVRPKRKK